MRGRVRMRGRENEIGPGRGAWENMSSLYACVSASCAASPCAGPGVGEHMPKPARDLQHLHETAQDP